MGSIKARQAEEVAMEFLRQQYSMITLEKSLMEDDGRIWVIEALTSSYDKEKKIIVRVNAMTGLLLGWTQNDLPI